MIKKKIEGHKMYLDPTDGGISKALACHGFREAGFMWMLRREACGVAIDIGANIGYCTISLADRCEKVYAYEPDPRSYKLLEMNTKKLSNVKIIPKAVTRDGGVVHITLADKPNLSSICIPGNGINVESVSLKSHFPEVVFIKMDIEGAEIDVLGGCMDKLIAAKNMKLLMEVHPKLYGERRVIFQDMLKCLLDAGYLFKYVENAKGKMGVFENEGYSPRKTFSHYQERSIFENIKPEHAIHWSTEMPVDGHKVVRSFMLCKGF